MKSGRDMIEVIKEICDTVPGPVSAGVVSVKADDMIAEGRKPGRDRAEHRGQVPTTQDGLKACKVLSDEGRMVNVTLCFSPNQAILAAKAGATFISPFIGRLDDIHLDGMELIRDIREIYDNYDYDTQILAASVRSTSCRRYGRIGADVITAPASVIKSLASHPLTDKGLAAFMADWERRDRRSCDVLACLPITKPEAGHEQRQPGQRRGAARTGLVGSQRGA